MRIVAVVGALALIIPGMALADPGGPLAGQYYVEGTVGYTLGTDVEVGGIDAGTQGGYLVGGALGKSLTDGLSFEIEATYASRDFDDVSASVDTLALMGNAYLDFSIRNRTGGYIGGGIGAINVELNAFGASADEWAFGYQAIAGLTQQASENAVVFIEYRYQGANEVERNSVTFDYSGHTIGAGVRFGFQH